MQTARTVKGNGGFRVKINPETLQKLKDTEFKILIEFDKVCKQLGINYTLSSGTLLGAVRHKGFIPWDDDIDVAMLRDDYDKFISEGQQFLPEHLFIQTYETDKEYPPNFAKIRDTSTVLVEYTMQNLYMKNGVYIDIFPIDRVSSNKVIRWLDNQILSLILAIKYSSTIEWAKKSSSRFRSIMHVILLPLARLIGTQNLNRWETFIRVKNNSNEHNTRTYYEKHYNIPPYRLKDSDLMHISIFNKFTNIEFEGRYFMAVFDYHSYLTLFYGDYMQPPPMEKRIPIHDFIKIEFNEGN